ncbi:MAG: hypothetical protein V4638_11030 [Bacteroidota bacterium]
MNKKRIISLVLAILIIGGLGYYAAKLVRTSGKSIPDLIEFAIEDTASVTKIVISDPHGMKMELLREGTTWTDGAGDCIQQQSVHFILEAIKKIEFKGYIPDNAQKNMLNLMSAQSTKVEIYTNGSWAKTWYIGPSSQDHYGQIMLLDDAAIGKSSTPVMMKIKDMSGIIEPRFFADKRKWICTNIFALGIDQISKVDLKFYDDPERSFTVINNNNHFEVLQQGKKIAFQDTSMVFRYLHNFKKIHFDLPNYELDEKGVAAMKKSQPFATLTLTEKNGKTKKLRMFRIDSEIQQINEMGIDMLKDANKFWCELPSGEMVKCQYFVFNPLLLGHIYFPMDMSGVAMGEAAMVN